MSVPPQPFIDLMATFSIENEEQVGELYEHFVRNYTKEGANDTAALKRQIKEAMSSAYKAIAAVEKFPVNPIYYVACIKLRTDRFIDAIHMDAIEDLYEDYLARQDAQAFIQQVELQTEYAKRPLTSVEDAKDAVDNFGSELDVAALCWAYKLLKTSNEQQKQLLAEALKQTIVETEIVDDQDDEDEQNDEAEDQGEEEN